MLSVGIVIYPGFQAFGLAVGSVFEYANYEREEARFYDVKLVSESGGLVRSSQGFEINTVSLAHRTFDTLIVLGDNECTPPSPGLVRLLHSAQKRTRRVAAVCTGAFVLANAGMLNGRRATTHWHYARELGKAFPGVSVDEDRIFVIDGQMWTSAGMSAGIDLALALIEADLGMDVSKVVARKLVLYHRRAGGQSQFSALLDMDAKSDRVQTALAFAKANLKADLSVETLADAAGLSPRQFSRVFRQETGHSPAKAVERLRVEAARLMLETTRHPVDVVAREIGFGDRERMRQSFLRAFGQPPQAIKRSSTGTRVGA